MAFFCSFMSSNGSGVSRRATPALCLSNSTPRPLVSDLKISRRFAINFVKISALFSIHKVYLSCSGRAPEIFREKFYKFLTQLKDGEKLKKDAVALYIKL